MGVRGGYGSVVGLLELVAMQLGVGFGSGAQGRVALRGLGGQGPAGGKAGLRRG